MTKALNVTVCLIVIGIGLLVTGCGGNLAVAISPISTYSLTVASTNPGDGMVIDVAPADNHSAGNGMTTFARTYDAGAAITLTAPATAGGHTFASWAGCSSVAGTTCKVVLNANTTVTANFTLPAATPTYVLTVNSVDPSSELSAVGDCFSIGWE